MTTMVVRDEAAVKALLGVPEHRVGGRGAGPGSARAPALELRRRPVEEFATVDRFDGAPLGPA